MISVARARRDKKIYTRETGKTQLTQLSSLKKNLY